MQFPSQRHHLLLLLLGLINRNGSGWFLNGSASAGAHLLRLIWELRDYPVDDAWLRDSDNYQNWAELPSDILADCDELLNGDGLAVSASQYADLSQLLTRLIARRAELKAGRLADDR